MSSIYKHDLMFGGQIKWVIFDHTVYDKFKNRKNIMTTTIAIFFLYYKIRKPLVDWDNLPLSCNSSIKILSEVSS